MKVLITGVRGFIGSHLYQYLTVLGHRVVGIDNLYHPCENDVSFEFADVVHPETYEHLLKECDVVVHCAAQIHVDRSMHDPKETVEINVLGTLNVLELCRKYNKRMVFASTSEVYGSSQVDFMNESHPLDGQSPYAASKTAADRMCFAYYTTYGLDVRILRNFNTFGPYQNDDSYGGVIAIFTRLALKGEPMRIFGSGEQMRDYMSIYDALKGYRICIETPGLAGQVINVGSGKTVTINYLAEKIKKLTKSKSKIIHVEPRPGEVMRLCADTTRARELGYFSDTDFDRDLAEYIKWYETSKKLKQ